MLNLSRLHLLSELAVLGTIAKVAEAVNLTRPAVSQQLAILEQETGAVLFERSGRGVRLTLAGESLVARSAKVLDLVNEIEADLASAKGAVAGEVRISAFGSVATTFIPAVFEDLLREFPQLDLRFEELEPGESLKAAAAKQVDLALVDDSISAEALSSMLYFRPVYEDHFSVVMAANHRLAKEASIQVSELSSENWAINRNAQTYKAQIVNACHEAGYTPRVVASCRNMAATLEMVRTGYVVTVLPALALRAAAADPAFAVVPVAPLMVRRIFVAMVQGTFRRPAIAAVLRALDGVVPRFAGTTQSLNSDARAKRTEGVLSD
ncbi:LysR family transcriptional regulator [Variovorax ginsengisoli]|jgi:DNA-binding transcriptional LysR family regulator|uniref:LysR family transcriptional regulator n=1 Tax=Variovorax ginsengisoli TaxID=363844 RepID=A0ABT8SGW3_9BURK|nr:LysR family transcriptional regulator [Variovorax ginsengisoli]MDN8618434.1 LysR family transcriptional regulator [Variovorax ginsengisoli]MDO1537604.1 LysR family transcriptional regulator [Variovorax ginsengisoli]